MCNCTKTIECTTCNECTTCCTCPDTISTTAIPLDGCEVVEYCSDGCVELVQDECVVTRCGTLEEVIDELFDEDCNAIPGCRTFGEAPVINVCQNEEADVMQIWLDSNPTLTEGIVHPLLTPEFVGSDVFTPTIVGTYLFQFSQFDPCFNGQLITLNVVDCVGLCPESITIANAYNSQTDIFDFTLTSPFPEDSIYRIKVTLPDTTLVAEIETSPGDITLVGNQIDATNWNNFDQYLSAIVLNAANLNMGISFTFDKEQWAIDNGYTYNSNEDTDATQLIFEFSIEKPNCDVETGTTTVNRVVGAMLGAAYSLYDNGTTPGILKYVLQTGNTLVSPVFATHTVSVATEIPATAIPLTTTTVTPTQIETTYTVAPFGTVPTTLNRYDLNGTTDLGHAFTSRGFEASGYDFTILHLIDSFTKQEEAANYNIDLLFRCYFQEAHWDETTIEAKTHFNSIGGIPITTPLTLTVSGSTSAASTHIYDAVEPATLAVGTYQLYSSFLCDFNYDNGVDGPEGATVQKTAFQFSELELNYIY